MVPVPHDTLALIPLESPQAHHLLCGIALHIVLDSHREEVLGQDECKVREWYLLSSLYEMYQR